MQIAFLTLFLGLIAGPQTVAVDPGAGVAAVELTLDGRGFAKLEHAPWTAGGAHVLSARLRFPDGLEVRKDVALTGDFGSDVATELTAAAVRGAAPGKPGNALADAVEADARHPDGDQQRGDRQRRVIGHRHRPQGRAAWKSRRRG